jgi:hypothetical protein
MECDENGLKVVTEKALILSHHKKSAEFVTSMDIEKVTKVTETFLGQLLVSANPDMFPAETLDTKAKVRLAREEIEGAMDAMERAYGTSWASPGLQLSATGIPWAPGDEREDWQGCEYCGEMERNGDCLIPWASTEREREARDAMEEDMH